MKYAILAAVFTLSCNLWAANALVSPFPSTVPGIRIANTHEVANGKSPVLRGMRPLNADDVQQLTDNGIRQILIFRNNVPGEDTVAEERVWLDANPNIKAVYEIPFKWKEIESFQAACEQTVQALRIMKNSAQKSEAGLFFHCTVGEDRTGYLAGLYRMIFEAKSPADVFKNEMCAYGYSNGNVKNRGNNIKPPKVTQTIDDSITPVFLKMATLIKSGKITADKLDESVCLQAPKISQKALDRFHCPVN